MTVAADLQNVVDAYPLTPIQEGMLYHTIAAPRSGVFVGQFAGDLEGRFDETAFRTAWDDVLARHPALRTIFLWEGLDDPLQVVRGAVELPWLIEDWRTLDPATRAGRLEARLDEDRERGFDPADAPLMRMSLLRVADDRWRWIWSAHHLISDGWSTSILLHELMTTYTARVQGDAPMLEPAVPYRTFVGWHAGRDRSADEAFWRTELQDFRAATRLAGPKPGGDRTTAGPRHRREERAIPAELAARLDAVTRERRLTPSTVVQGAWSLLLSRLAGEDDVVVGVTTSGRPPELDGIERAVGVFINTLPLRVRIDDAAPAAAWLHDIQSRHLDVRAREHSALADVQRWSDLPRGEALFESIVVFENYPGGLVAGAPEVGLAMRNIAFIEQSNFPLAILFMPGENAHLVLVHDQDRVDAAHAGRLADQLLYVLEQLTARLDDPVGAVDVLRPVERAEILERWTGAGESLDDGEVLPAMIERAGRECPAGTEAVRDPRGSITHAELAARANTIAAALRRRGVGPEVPVGLLSGRTLDMVVGILAIHRAGGAYVPLDPTYPEAHRRRVITGAGVELVLAADELAGDMTGAAELTFAAAMAEAGVADEAAAGPASDDLAYVIHTSGSTGQPKGVMITHRALAHSTRARESVYGDAPDRFLLLSSMAFDSSVAGIFWTLAGGGTLVLPPERIEQDMGRLAALIEREAITHLLCLPTLWGLLLEHAAGDQLRSLNTIIVAGEACPPDVVAQHHRQCPDVRLFNEYGPTEGTVWCTVQPLTVAHAADAADGSPVPIGRPIPGARIHLLDSAGRLVPPGVPGEIHLGGAGLARGYLGDHALTADRFVERTVADCPERLYRTGDLAAWRPDGALTYYGRADGQLKIRGHRIEPEGVAAILRGEPGIADAVVDGRSIAGSPRRLVAWYVPDADGPAVDAAALRTKLRAEWSAAMVPDVLVAVDELPRLANGKVDRGRLPDPDPALIGGGAAEPPVEPRDDIERQLADIWRDVLGVSEFGVRDDFFDLGGDSLISIRVMSRIEQAFGRSLPLSALLEHGTIEAIAGLIRGGMTDAGEQIAANMPDVAAAPSATANGTAHVDGQASGGSTTATAPAGSTEGFLPPPVRSLVPFRRTGSRTPLFCVHAGGGHVLEYRNLARQLDVEHPLYGLEPVGLEGECPPMESTEEMAAHYVAAIRTIQPEGPYVLVGHCTGATICWEMARRLADAGQRTALLVVLDASPPGGHRDKTLVEKVAAYARTHGLRTIPYAARRVRVAVEDRVLRRVRNQVRQTVGSPEARRLAIVEEVRAASQRAYMNYEGVPADVPVLQIRSSEFTAVGGKDRHLGWSRYAENLERHIIESRHDDVLQRPAVEHVAELVSRRLAALDPPDAAHPHAPAQGTEAAP